MSDRLRRADHEHDLATPLPSSTGTPGKSTLTSRISRRAQPVVVLRVESAEAARELGAAFGPRDDNGVAAGAEHAVERASSSSGAPLPAELRGRFEASLGADLSSVRLHTGAASQSAAAAVGARAYTTGQDIHFGAGQYDPSSGAGLHLIAHEVAHTVQQQGAAPTRQHKLEVSAPADACEHEADRAADAMVRGESFAVSRGGAVARKPVQRDYDGDAGVPNVPDASGPTAPPKPVDEGPCPVKPVRWDTQILENPAEVSGAWAGQPAINATHKHSKVRQGVDDYAGVWAQIAGVWNSFTKLVPDKAAAEVKAEDAAARASVLGAAPGRLPGTDVAIEQVFDDKTGKLAAKHATFDAKKIPVAKRLEMIHAKKALGEADDKVVTAMVDVRSGFRKVLDAADAFAKGQNEIDKAIAEAGKKELENDKKELERYKTAVAGTINGITSIAKGICGEKGKGAGDIVTGIGKIVETGANAVFDYHLQQIDNNLLKADQHIAALQIANLRIDQQTRQRAIQEASDQTKKPLAALTVAMNARQKAYDDFSLMMMEAATKSGATPEEASKVQAAVQAIPFMEQALGRCGDVERAFKMPDWNESNGIGAAVTGNNDDLYWRAGALVHQVNEATRSRRLWETRLTAANTLVGQVS
jgi:hypothetical protein